MKKIIQICPTFPPNIGGVGSYAKILGDSLRKKGIKSDYFVSQIQKKNLFTFKKKTFDLINLLRGNDSSNIILHFSGYGYANRGLCFDLINCLNEWKKTNSNNRLITIFHEIYAKGPLYRISFWTHFFQKFIAKKLLNLSNISIVTSKENKFELISLNSKKKILYTNVISNIGELNKNKNLKKRKKLAVIFGSSAQKESLYNDIILNEKKYLNIMKKMAIKKIIDIGPKIQKIRALKFLELKSVGIKPKKYISTIMRKSKLGIVYYSVSQMTKSGIVAAYVSHGLLVLNRSREHNFKKCEFIPGNNFISDDAIKNVNFQKIADKSFKNYHKYNIENLTKLILKILKKKKN